MAYNFKSESEVKEFIKNLGIEYRFGCYSEKKPEVCHLLGDYLEAIDKNFKKAGKIYQNNCDDYKFPDSCKKYATYALLGKGLQSANFPTAYNYFEKGCNLNNPESCLHQGLLLISPSNESGGVEQNITKGMSLLERSCKANNANACYYLSGMYISGVKKDEKGKDTPENYKVQKNMSKAFQYASTGCELDNIYCCVNLSQMYAKGEGVAKNLELAEKFKAKALEMQKETENTKSLKFQQGLV